MPHYCYHNKLSIAGNCRICFVELERAVKPIVSCSTNIDVLSNKSKIFLDTPLVKKARENIMEFLLLNHPLDCPICDQGGDCDLQDQSLFFGFSKRRFYKFKRVVNDKELGPIVKTVMTRCIHCTRCVRFLSEIAESGELGMMGRGVSSEIGTYSKSLILSELSGNIVDLCPVGALTHKTFSHEIRGWDVEKRKAIDPTDNLGVPVKVLMNNSEIVMVEPYLKDDSVNYFISDKTRHFFDSISKTSGNTIANKSFKSFTNLLHKNLYLFELSDLKYQIKNYFTLLIGNLNINTLCLLSFYEQKYKFLKLQKIENKKLNNDFEYLFKFNTVKLKKSNICLFIGTNTYKESMMLNLKLKQRHSKGNFKSFIIGSTLRITFDIISVGSTLQVLKYITEGKNLICQSLSKNPFLVSFNSELFKRKDGEQVSNLLVYLNSLNNYCDLNCLNSSIYETGIFAVNNFLPLNSRDSLHFSSVYLLNVTNYSKKYLDKILQTYLIYSNTSENLKVLSLKKKLINQTSYRIDRISKGNEFYDYLYLPSKNIFEKKELFYNAKGLLKYSLEIMVENNLKSSWKLIRNIFNKYKKKLWINDNFFLDLNRSMYFTYFISLFYMATIKLNKRIFFVQNSMNSFLYYNNLLLKKRLKLVNSKFKFWLNDFYLDGKDGFSFNSTTLAKCSYNHRLETNNFYNYSL